MTRLRIDRDRLWQSLMDMATIGATPKGGSRRLALSDEDKKGRDTFVEWCRAAGCTVTIDSLGNIFARRPGTDDALAPVVAGSHLDTQPHGGKFDGVYGVLAGLEVIRTLDAHEVRCKAPVEVAVWTNEEGARFAPSMMASGAFAGVYEADDILAARDRAGKTVAEELHRIGYAGDEPCGEHAIGSFFEAHIEQGPILEQESTRIGVVTSVQGVAWYDVTVVGQDSHAGSTPMDGRLDALLGASRMVGAINELAHEHSPAGRATVGEVQVSPNSRNTVPGRVLFTVDLRHPKTEVIQAMDSTLEHRCQDIAEAGGLQVKLERIAYTAPVHFADQCIKAVRGACETLSYSHRDMLSGAGHDACHISRVAPTAMIFVPCAGGISHNEEEWASPDDLADGCNVLLHAILDRAG